jgi:hypothetical protein
LATRIDEELELYRDLMEVPSTYEDGFNWKTVLGAFFIGFVMMPGAIYLGLVAGQSLGAAAEWTTIILFTEVARRSFTTLRRQEIYLLFYVASAVSGGAFAGLIWNQYFVQSPAARGFGIAENIPSWVVPQPNSPAIVQRTFFHRDWLFPILLLLFGQIVGRAQGFTGSYALFRITSDIEKLPFPLAPIAAQGSTALAEITTKEETWRWRIFSIGAMIGLVFGVFYVGIPSVTGAILTKPLQLLPIPFIDLTRNTEKILPATATGITPNLGLVITGLVLPFWVVMGGFISAILTLVACPLLYHWGVLTTWREGMETINTTFANSIDFFMSVGIGTAFAVAVIGFYSVGKQLRETQRERRAGARGARSFAPPPGRGDFSLWLAVGIFFGATLMYVILCAYLVEGFPWWYFVIFGFIITPMESYVNARMVAIVGQYIGIPYVREAAFLLSGYKGVDIWFAPIPLGNYGGGAQGFRILELTGNKITSMLKAEVLLVPVMLFCSFIFWSFMWKLAPIPSQAYPFAQKMWHLQALRQALWMTATTENNQLFLRAIHWNYIIGGFVFGLGLFMILSRLGLPTMLVYGLIRGSQVIPHDIFPEVIGAFISRYYLEKRFGKKRWKQYATVLAAGFSCGTGLIGMGCVAIAMISKSVTHAPY